MDDHDDEEKLKDKDGKGEAGGRKADKGGKERENINRNIEEVLHE